MKFLMTLIMLTSLSSAYASSKPQIIIAGSDYIEIAYKTTRMPYNVLLGRGPKCYLGSVAEVEAIVKKMVNNHSFGRDIQKVDVTAGYDNEIDVVIHNYRTGVDRISLSRCSID